MNLTNNKIKNGGLKHISDGLSYLKKLTEFKIILSHNDLDDTNIDHFVDALSNYT